MKKNLMLMVLFSSLLRGQDFEEAEYVDEEYVDEEYQTEYGLAEEYVDEEYQTEDSPVEEETVIDEGFTDQVPSSGVRASISDSNVKSINAEALSQDELRRIFSFLPNVAATITKKNLFEFLDAETLYYNNPEASIKKTDRNTYASNPYLQFLYVNDFANKKEFLSHKTNGVTFYNSGGVYSLRIGLEKDDSPLPKSIYAKKGELQFVVFSKRRFAPLNTHGETVKFSLYGLQNKKLWSKVFSFDSLQAENQTFQGGIYSLTLSAAVEQSELESLGLLFGANDTVFGKIEGPISSYMFDFKKKASYFYRFFLEYGKKNRYY